jgi:hypothetical protein
MNFLKKSLFALLLFLGLTTQSHAFFGQLIEGMTSVANNMVDSSETVVNNGIDTSSETVLGLSDDIGSMADRIGDMADKIGEMGDRIVKTEEIMVDLTTELVNGRQNDNSSAEKSYYEGETVLLTTEYGVELTHQELPTIEYNNNSSEYLLYIASSPKINSNSTSFLIRNHKDLKRVWGQIVGTFAKNARLFIAIKTIDGNSISNLSNTILINVQ